MGKMLILTEKPSVGRDFAKALGCNQKGDGFIEGGSAVVTWAFGHLLESAPPEAYNPELKDWRFDKLPIIPDQFRFMPTKDGSKQLNNIVRLVKRKDIESVVIATDAGREGEVIARLILNHAGCRKKVYRFWTSQALTPEIISYGMQKGLKPATSFDRIWQAGYQRTMADWLVGMNLTRCASIKMGGQGVFSVGRVQTAVLALLVDRLRHREHFVPEPYWVFKCLFENQKGEWTGTWFKGNGADRETRFWNKEDARRIAQKVQGKTGQVTHAEKQKRRMSPPPLYSLTVLQREANRAFGFTAQQTLDTAQSLYEKHQAISYPRTDSQVLGSQNVQMAKNLSNKLSRSYPDLFKNVQQQLFSEKNKRVFNDAKLTDHHALIPLKPAQKGFSDAESKIYDLILTRFAAAFHPDYEYESTEIVTTVEEETFLTRGSVALSMGWRALFTSAGASGDDDILPPLKKGDPAAIKKMDGEEKKTTPLAEYTEDSLLNDMSNPAKYVEDQDLKDIYRGDVGLGTQATRAQTIETLLKRQYAERDKKKIIATDKGCALIDYIRKLKHSQVLASPEETAKWEQMLNTISLGEFAPEQFESQIRDFVMASVEEFKCADGGSAPASAGGTGIGVCPECGAAIVETPKGFGCSNYRSTGCSFVIWKTIASKALTIKDAVALLAGEKTRKMKFTSRQKKKFEAQLELVKEQGAWKTQFVFADSGGGTGGSGSVPSGDALGKCPSCGGDIFENGKAFSCSNWQSKGCKFVIWKTIAKRSIDQAIVRELLENGRTASVVTGFKSKKGANFDARLFIDYDENRNQMTVMFDFPG